MKYLLGIDIGSTNIKAVAFDFQGTQSAVGIRPIQQFRNNLEQPDWVVWKPETIWSSLVGAIKDVANEIDVSLIAGIAVTGMGMDGIPIDANGNCLYPCISWHDLRTIPQQEWWLENVGADSIYKICGRDPMHICSINRMMWIKKFEPDIYEKTFKWLLIENYINYILCGKIATDYTLATTTQAFDCLKLDWSNELISKSGVRLSVFPPVLQCGTLLGKVHEKAAYETGLCKNTPVVLGGHDYLCAAFATAGSDTNTLVNIIGSWEMFVATVKRIRTDLPINKGGLFWDTHVVKEMHSLIAGSVAGSMVEWYRQHFGSIAEDRAARRGCSVWNVLMEEASESQPGANGLIFLPHLDGSCCPVTDSKSKGAFLGITNSTTRGMFVRAIIEGLNYQSCQMIEEIEKITGKLSSLKIVGGTVRNEFWMQNKADILGRSIEVVNIEEMTCLGAAILAGIGTGVFSSCSDAFDNIKRPSKLFYPNHLNHIRYKAIYANVFKDLYKELQVINYRIYDVFKYDERT